MSEKTPNEDTKAAMKEAEAQAKLKADAQAAQDKLDAEQAAADDAQAKAAQAAASAKQPKDTSEKKAGKTSDKVRAVFGDMIDLETGHCYTTAPSDVLVHNGWLEYQVEHGKMQYIF